MLTNNHFGESLVFAVLVVDLIPINTSRSGPHPVRSRQTLKVAHNRALVGALLKAAIQLRQKQAEQSLGLCTCASARVMSPGPRCDSLHPAARSIAGSR